MLKDDDYFREMDIAAPLERLAGAERRKTSWGSGQGTKPSCIQVPIEHLRDGD